MRIESTSVRCTCTVLLMTILLSSGCGHQVQEGRPEEQTGMGEMVLETEDEARKRLLTLGSGSDGEVIGQLLEDLKEGQNARERYAVIRKLLVFGEDATGPLIRALDDSDPYVRGFAAFGLQKIEDRRAVEPLIQRLQDEGIFDFGDGPGLGTLFVAHSAADALERLGDRSAVPQLKIALEKARARRKLAWQQGDYILNADEYVAKEGLVQALERALSSLGAPPPPESYSIEELIAQLGDENVWLDAMEKLTAMGDSAVPSLAEALQCESDTACNRAIEVLADIGSRQAIQALREATKGPNRSVRYRAMGALERLESASEK